MSDKPLTEEFLRQYREVASARPESGVAILLAEIDRLRAEYKALAAEVREWTQWPSSLKEYPGMYPHIDKALAEASSVD